MNTLNLAEQEKHLIEIALAADGKYFDPLFVTATSMAAYCRTEDVVLNFNILDGGIADSDWEYLVGKVSELHPKSAFNKIPVDQKLFEKFPVWNGNRMAYARLLLPEVLKDKDWVLYSDCDFLWLRDVAELWRERDARYAIASVRDVNAWESGERDWFVKNGYQKRGERYFCSGVCLINLKMFRSENLTEQSYAILARHSSDMHFADQTALNVVCAGREKMLEKKWMVFAFLLTQEWHRMPSVIHYAGGAPWCFTHWIQPIAGARLLWHQFNASVRGISTWGSFRRHFSFRQILWHLLMGKIASWNIARNALRIICEVTGHRAVYRTFTILGERLTLPQY